VFRGIGSGIGMRPRNKAILWAVAFAVVGILYVFSREPSRPDTFDNCPAKGIDPEQMVEGYCLVGHTTTVVVDKGHLLQLETLDARLEGMRERTTMSGPDGTKLSAGEHEFVTFDLTVTNTPTGRNRSANLSSPYLVPGARTPRSSEATNPTPSSTAQPRSPPAKRPTAPSPSK
jgi:hypothetical protein